jgi:uncharacterized protein
VSALAALVVIAKEPIAGRVKTRLVPPLRAEEAAAVAAAALTDTLATVAAIPADEHVLAFDGDSRAWLPSGWRVSAQPAGGLDARIAAAFEATRGGPAVLVGMDTPQLRADHLVRCDFTRYDACLGPATDGGFWALGLADPSLARAAVAGVPMSTARTGAIQLARLVRLGLRVQLLAELTDVDTIETADEVAGGAPETAFAAALAACRVAG